MFQVEWLESAIDRLEEFWNQADARLRRDIMDAADNVNRRLALDPHHEGESRAFGARITFVWPLVVWFRLEPDGQTVTVIRVRLLRGRRP